mmetsp:Transcript_23655/g.72776  ORF Transcript_23655/g.72776 Transcript_23655/m.72776 type:complete len:218 (-) Transcript_23655:1578-2231(-)
MLKNRVGLMVGAHPKHQTMRHPLGKELGDLEKLKDVMASDQVLLELTIAVPVVTKTIEEVSDDEGYVGPEEEPPPPDAAEGDASLQDEADAAARSGDLAKALELYSQIAGSSANLLCRRGDVLLKLSRPLAAKADATKALSINPDSAKAYKLRAKAFRKLGEYDKASADFGQAQRIDFDDSVAQEQAYVTKRATKLRARQLALQEQAAAEDAGGAAA